jgi:hypothetical protein
MASTRIYRTAGTPTLNTKHTISMWFKRTKLTYGDCFLMDGWQDANNRFKLAFDASDRLECYNTHGGSYKFNVVTNRRFRDTAAFYHLVIRIDTTQASASDRVRVYVNGTEEESFHTYTDATQDDANNVVNESGATISIGDFQGGGNAFEGLMAHVHFVDGTSYAPTTFGETDSTSGIWVPKTSPSVTYGNNGFFLKFENEGDMDLDSSGNGHTFTTSGSLTQNVDTPTNNFAVLNSLYYTTTSGTLSFAGRNFTKASSVNRSCFSTLAAHAGKYYCEVKVFNDTDCKLGIVNLSYDYNLNGQTVDFAASGGAYSYNENGQKQVAGASATSYGDGYNADDIIGIAMDLDNSKLYFSLNGVFQDSGDPTSGSTGTGAISIAAGGDYAFAGKVNGGCNLGFNFGSGDYSTSSSVASSNADDNGIGSFEYDVPAGYYALCTKNIRDFGG